MPSDWITSKRAKELPGDWKSRRAAAIEKAGGKCQMPGCTARATEVDHKGDPQDHSPANLRALCSKHHAAKTSAEANAKRWHGTKKAAGLNKFGQPRKE